MNCLRIIRTNADRDPIRVAKLEKRFDKDGPWNRPINDGVKRSCHMVCYGFGGPRRSNERLRLGNFVSPGL